MPGQLLPPIFSFADSARKRPARLRALIVTFTMVVPGLWIETQALAQVQWPTKATGSIAGRVTLNRQPAPGVTVALQPSDGARLRSPVAQATTNEDGRFRLWGVAGGTYRLTVFAPAYVVAGQTESGLPGKTLTLGDGEALEGIDLVLVRGGVMTGRVTDADGRSVIDEPVKLTLIEPSGRPLPLFSSHPSLFRTDDRGWYRIFGLSPGRYLVNAGDGNGAGVSGYPRTFYPNVTDEVRARPVEVPAGGEVTGIDIRLGRPSKTYTASGRVVDAETGQPIPRAAYSYASLQTEAGVTQTGLQADAAGEFHIEGLAPGRYTVFAGGEEPAEFYSDPVNFEIAEGDLDGLEIKLRRGASISGTAVLQGANNPSTQALLSRLEVMALGEAPEMNLPRMVQAHFGPDGSFRLGGLPPGLTRLSLVGSATQVGVSLVGFERNGIRQPGEINLGPGEQVTGVRLILAPSTGLIRGQVVISGGTMPEGTQLRVSFQSAQEFASPASRSVAVDAQQRFVIEGLVAGIYELTLQVMPASPGLQSSPNLSAARQTVTVTSGAEAQATLVLDVRAKEGDR